MANILAEVVDVDQRELEVNDEYVELRWQRCWLRFYFDRNPDYGRDVITAWVHSPSDRIVWLLHNGTTLLETTLRTDEDYNHVVNAIAEEYRRRVYAR